jgi:protein CpxP
MKAIVASFALVVMLCGQAIGQESMPPLPEPDAPPAAPMMNQPGGPPPRVGPGAEGMWWKDPDLVQKLHVADDQIRRIEKIAQDHEIQEVDLRAALEKHEVTLRFLMDSDQPDESTLLAEIDKVAQARGELEKSHVHMILAMRRVLTAEQTKKLRELRPVPPFPVDQEEPGFGLPGGVGGPRPDGPPPQPAMDEPE